MEIIKNKGETYGYEIVTEMKNYGFGQCTEGTIYPLLTRLEKRKSLKSQKKESNTGPPRKYYSLTEDGIEEIKDFYKTWNEFKNFVNVIFKDYEED